MARVVIRFDFSSEIPQNVDIKKAVCSIFFIGGSVGDKYTTAYPLIKEWDESKVSWVDAGTDALWSTPGGDYSDSKASKVDYVPDSTWEHYDVSEFVQKFTHGIPNHGFIIASDQTNGNTGRVYCSSEFSDTDSLRPKLTVTYSSSGISSFIQGQNLLDGIKLKIVGNKLSLFVPFEKSYQVSLLNSSGKLVGTVYGNSRQWYKVTPATISNGVYFVHVRMDNQSFAGKVILFN